MSSFGGTVKLTGESEYRKALAEISSNLKVLNSEMKTVTSQYDKNDKSAENLSQQNEVLNKKIAEQQKAVDILTDALEKSKRETGDNSEQTRQWQIKLNNAQADLNKMNRELEENKSVMKDAAKKTDDGAEAVEKFGKEADTSGEKTMKLGDIIKGSLASEAIMGALNALADGIKAVGNAMKEVLTEGAEYADNIMTLSAQTGLSTDTLEKYNAVAELTDVSLETMTSSMAKNIKAMSQAKDGSKTYAEAYEKLGISVTDAQGNLRDSETVYWETIDALKGVENETERDALAMELFGKKAQDLNTIIEMGSDGVAEYTQKAVDMGAVLGGKGLEALGDLDDQMQIFKSTTASTKNILASAFAPALADALEGVNGLTGSFNELIAAVISGDQGGVDGAMQKVSDQASAMISSLAASAPKVIEVAKNLISTIFTVLEDNLPLLLREGEKLLSSILGGISSNIGKVGSMAGSLLKTLVTGIIESLPLVWQCGIELIVSLAKSIEEMLPSLIPLAVNCILTVVNTLLDNIQLVCDVAFSIVMALCDGIVLALPDLVAQLPIIIEKFITFFATNYPKFKVLGYEVMLALLRGIISSIPQLLLSIPQIVRSFVDGYKIMIPQFWNVGKNLVMGIWEGISDMGSWIVNNIGDFGKSILKSFKNAFGIHSPSRLFRDEVGKNLALGVGEGFTDTMRNVTDEMTSAMPTDFDASINASVNGMTAAPMTYETMVSAFKKALTEVKVVMDDREMGGFVTNTIEKVVFA